MLFATPPDGFVAARNALAKRLRADQRRDEAAEVAALRKPARAVWALNHLALRDDPHLADLLDAIDAVAGADPAGHREAVAALRDRLGDTADAAVAAIGEPRAADHPEVTAALQAVVGDPESLARLVDGRLRDVPAGGLGALGLLPGPPAGRGRAPRPSGRARPKLGLPRSPTGGSEVEDEPDEGPGTGAGAEVDESLVARRRAKERERLERAVVEAVSAHDTARRAEEAARADRADRSQRLAALDDELAAAEAALAALREERDGQARAVAEAEVAERDAADSVAAAAAGEEAARAALADHRD